MVSYIRILKRYSFIPQTAETTIYFMEGDDTMQNIRNITDKILWVGASDRRLHLFENMFPIPDGVAYNSYVILDEKTAILDTADSSVSRQYLENLTAALGGRQPDYLVVNHMEPDHCADIAELARLYPAMQIVGNQKTFGLMKQFYNMDLEGRTLTVKEGDVLDLGEHKLTFVMAPMVHWPEAMMTYETTHKILFSADAFGSFGALDGAVFNDENRDPHGLHSEMRRYYSNIVGKYGMQVQAVLKKAAGLEIAMICPLHGPVWREDLGWLLDKYQKWSSYTPEENTVAIFYGSMYGNTAEAADLLAGKLAAAGVKGVTVRDVSKTDVSYLISDVFRASHLVLAAPTYNNGLYPKMANFIEDMKALNVQNRTVSIIENGSWAPQSGKIMRAMLGEMKDMTVLEKSLTVRSALKEEQLSVLDEMTAEILASLNK